ncbi:MAG: family 78 glycoside hydrolase catalytic domain [Muribaculaceae bacterium]|nr:family 78 glycoside hydrolase catalytic domain [Muribaculaceae bacterium]
MKKSVLCFLAAMVALGVECRAQEIVRLRTDYQTNPMGIETERPYLSWQSAAQGYGKEQKAYRIVVALSEEALAEGNTLWDSGKVESAASVAVPLEATLEPATRYWWKVQTWDTDGNRQESAATWFETGLKDQGWSGAQWIAGQKVPFDRYRQDAVIDFDIRTRKSPAEFIFCATDSANYLSVEIDTAKKELRAKCTSNGNSRIEKVVDLSKILADAKQDAPHHVRLVIKGKTSGTVNVNMQIDGQDIKEKPKSPLEALLENPETRDELLKAIEQWGEEVISGYLFGGNAEAGALKFTMTSDNDRIPGRIINIGVNGKDADFTNMSVSESRWNTVFSTIDRVKADGLKIWNPSQASAPMMRKTIAVDKVMARARLYVTARGIYEFEINGRRIGADFYNPGWSDFKERIFYNTYDVTDKLVPGQNGLGVTLGAGWFADYVGMSLDPYGAEPSVMAMLVIDYKDSSRQTIVTDGSWKASADGPVTSNSMQTGQDYDARREIPDWSCGSFDDSGWSAAKTVPAPADSIRIQAYVGETIRNNVALEAVAMTEPEPGVYIYDMGQNMVGVPRLENLCGRAGQTVTLRYAEMLFPETIPSDPVEPYTVELYQRMKGRMYTENYRDAMSTDHYTLRGDAAGETFEPHFTQHGYRYVEITGLNRPLALADVKGIVLESIGEQLSEFECSDPDLNRLFSNIVWGQRGNFLSVPTDCPQRNERMGWMGDAQIFARSATYNMMTDGFFNRWMYALRDTQGANGSYGNTAPAFEKGGDALGWMEAGIIVPWQVYMQYGDKRILEDHYASMSAYMDFLGQRANGHIQPGGMFGDWLAIDNTNSSLTNTAYYAYDAILMQKIASALGKADDAEKYAALYQDIKRAWNSEFVDSEGYTRAKSNIFATAMPAPPAGGMKDVMGKALEKDPEHPDRQNTQTSYVIPLYADLFNDANKPLAIDHLVKAIEKTGYTITTGFIGTPYICHVLSNNGRSDVAYRLFEQSAFPSWKFPVQQGATTIWERWNSYTKDNGFGPVDMNSFNHYSYGAIEEWIITHVLGIERDEAAPGYKHFFLAPEVGGNLSYAKGGFETVYGKISCAWQKTPTGFTYSVTVPANTSATLTLPSPNVTVIAGAPYARALSSSAAATTLALPSGTYEFLVPTE